MRRHARFTLRNEEGNALATYDFDTPGSGFSRINIATQRAYLARALEQLEGAVAARR